jgi:hypothetical protein
MLDAVIRARQLIPSALQDIIRKAPLSAEKVDFAWNAAVGPLMRRATLVHLEDDGVLRVAADAHWSREVNRSSRIILARLAEMLGDGVIRRITTADPPSRRNERRASSL